MVEIEFIDSIISQAGVNPRTGKSGALRVAVVDSRLVAHQQCAVRILAWLAECARSFCELGQMGFMDELIWIGFD